MFDKLSEKDKKTLKMGGIAAVVILVLMLTMQGYGSWNKNKDEYNELINDLNKVNLTDSMRNTQISNVPKFQMPQTQQTQKTLFRDELDGLFDELRITTAEPWQDLETKTRAVPGVPAGYDILQLKCSGSCRFEQILDLLAGLKNNPYLAGIEELNIQCEPQNPQQATFSITVSTFTNNKRG
jgi:hypothetical protein